VRRTLATALACLAGSVGAQSSGYDWQPAAMPAAGGAARGGSYAVQACADAGGARMQGGSYAVDAGACAALGAIGEAAPPPPGGDAIFASSFEG
jgi:hypothetical protein